MRRGMWMVTWCTSGVFFFQAEDGIRDWSVTGVQTCALPISPYVVRVLGLFIWAVSVLWCVHKLER